MKPCLRCGGPRPKRRSKWCRDCALEVIAEHERTRARKWYHRNRERALRYRKAYYRANRERILAWHRAHYARRKQAAIHFAVAS